MSDAARPQPLQSRIVRAVVILEALESALRDAAETQHALETREEDFAWSQLELAADAALAAAGSVRTARAHLRAAALRGAAVP